MVGNMSLDPRGRGRQLLEEDKTDKGLHCLAIPSASVLRHFSIIKIILF